ncbi:hypothetical protein FC98_GL000363 [Lentilactobacillus kisonensis DSM 19906 = JCM 15041]|uniref:Nucleotidyltransferase family protein n=3 Tax=Lentilactobacillus kisonensis TaxID=481722 RepID=A0A0R1NWF8_9LACO|nr:hypothetical protein FC98_GL000363 [Lentilactobacillus kisonensis DSM 19906 = JCM 15041]
MLTIGRISMLRSDKQIKSIIRDNANLMKILKIIHDLHLKQAALAAGSIRNTVWQTLSEQPITLINDIDVVFFDPTMPKSTDRLIQQDLNDCASEFNWQVKNEVYMNDYDFPNSPMFTSVEDAIAHFVETPTCIGAYLLDGGLKLIAPYGTDDLINMRCQPIPLFRKDEAHLKIYRNRILKKQWQRKWPRLTIDWH